MRVQAKAAVKEAVGVMLLYLRWHQPAAAVLQVQDYLWAGQATEMPATLAAETDLPV